MATADALQASVKRGSMYRGGRSLVAIGDNQAYQVVPPGTQITIEFSIDEPGVLDRLILHTSSMGCIVTALTLDNDNLVSGFVSAGTFTDQSQSPVFGQRVTQNSKLKLLVLNPTGNAIELSYGFTVR
jgi:hypothetical protein